MEKMTNKEYDSKINKIMVYIKGMFKKKDLVEEKKVANTTNNWCNLTNKTIVIDAGHGGKDSGAYDGKSKNDNIVSYEKNLNLEIAKLVYKKLKSTKAKVILTRNNDEFLELSERTNIANKANANIFVSIHFNAYVESANGIETFKYSKTKNPISHKLANNLQTELIKATGLKNRGVKTSNFYVLKHTKMPASLVELGFITNNKEEKTINTKEFKEKVANAIVKGIINTLK